jgi:hypothetical protein
MTFIDIEEGREITLRAFVGKDCVRAGSGLSILALTADGLFDGGAPITDRVTYRKGGDARTATMITGEEASAHGRRPGLLKDILIK